MILLLLLPTPSPAAPLDEADLPSDVVASVQVQAPPAAVHDVIVDTNRVARLAPDCWRHWDVALEGETFEVVYRVKLFRRKLEGRRENVSRPRRVEWDHVGDKGFVTRFLAEPADGGGTALTMTTFVAPPGWPLRRYWKNRIHPTWVACQQELLGAVAEAAVTDTAGG